MHDYLTFFQAIVFILAVFFTFAWSVSVVHFYTRTMRNLDASIGSMQSFLPAVLWGIFFWLCKVTF